MTAVKRRKKINKKIKKRKIFNKDNYLYYIFFGLLVLVIILAFLVFNTLNKHKKNTGNIVISVNEKHEVSELDFDLSELSKRKDYALKLTNFEQNNINKERFKYSITITNDTNAKIYIWKDYEDKNLMLDQKATIIEGVSFDSDEKEYDIYHFSVINKKKVKKGDKIHLKILAQKV